MDTRILIVDDEPSIIDLLEYNLRRDGYEVIIARDGHRALQLARTEHPDLVVLDLMLPGLDGLDVCRALRQRGNTPIIMLTARDDEIDRVLGLELGADDYVTKPFSVRELMARIKAVLRRANERGSGHAYRVDNIDIDTLAREIRLRGRLLNVTRLEFDLLEALASHAGQVLSREQLINIVWGYDYYGDTRAVDSAVKRIRSKLRQAGGNPDAIGTVRGIGYRLETE